MGYQPAFTSFVPSEGQASPPGAVVLSIDEYEALRLKDLEGLDQSECATRMEISQPTFHRLVTAARRKVAEALTHGMEIRIEGGHYRLGT